MGQHVAIDQRANIVGTKYALIRDPAGTFAVWVMRGNYAGHVCGGVAYSWRVCAQKMSEPDARALYSRKLNGRAK